ncbi:proline-tRNA ligase [Phytophthora cinnamomi]|uniref:proline-tRNA ligase n=1 Tax=Phytophthora cinnamomi TaxID=4785 RepID=UPI0035599F54|nr:proline-tRNA ligase [Phytophthora cinnamomi]
MATLDKSVADVEVSAALQALSISFEARAPRAAHDRGRDRGAEPPGRPEHQEPRVQDKKEGLFLVTAAPTAPSWTPRSWARAPAQPASAAEVEPALRLGGRANEVRLVLDKALLDATQVNCHPLRNDQTYSLRTADLLKFVKHYNHEPIVVDFAARSRGRASRCGQGPQGQEGGRQKKVVEQKANEGMSVSRRRTSPTGTRTPSPSQHDRLLRRVRLLHPAPYSYTRSGRVQQFLDRNLKAIGVKNCYFPCSSDEGPHRHPPTSETIMYPAFKNWIRSHRDLPMKLNQWNNVVRWEFKNPRPSARASSCGGGHTAHAMRADEEVRTVLDFYAACYEELLAVPMVKGVKTEKEKFAGADVIEGFIPRRAVYSEQLVGLHHPFAGVMIMVHEADKRRVYTPGWKYNHWELKGVPLRFEVGPKDIAKKQVRVIQQDMLDRATAQRDSHIREVVKTKSRESLALMGLEDEAENAATSAAAKTLCIPYKKATTARWVPTPSASSSYAVLWLVVRASFAPSSYLVLLRYK